MAKCTICKARKGKRKCQAQDAWICSLCCGETRRADVCEGCSFYKNDQTVRNYKKVPYFPLKRMSQDTDLEYWANNIESAICRFDADHHGRLDDALVSAVLERLMDRYHFQDVPAISNKLEKQGCQLLENVIAKALRNVPAETIVKLLATIYRSVRRHTADGREYLEFIHKHVGRLVIPGIRAINFFK